MKSKESYYSRNKEKVKAYTKQYKKSHPEKIKMYSDKYYEANKEEISKKCKQRRIDNIDKYKMREGQYDKNHPGVRRNYQLKRKFGITIETYNEMFNKQNGKCAICGKSDIILCVDHNHTTNMIRGLLCHQCNLVLGNANEDITILNNSIKYLQTNLLPATSYFCLLGPA